MNFPTIREEFTRVAQVDHKRRRGSPLHSQVQRALAMNDKQRRPNGRQSTPATRPVSGVR